MKIRNNLKLIFDTRNQPQLSNAIVARLKQFGFSPCNTHPWNNVSIGYKCNQKIHYGGCISDTQMWDNFRLTTLNDLYDIPKDADWFYDIPVHTVSFDGDDPITINAASLEELKAVLA